VSVAIHRPGLLTTVQDLGRWGHQSAGVPVAGPMDAWSHRLANRLLGNAEDAAVLEVTVTGPVFECGTDASIAITGAPFAIRVGEDYVRSPLLIHAAAGSILEFGECLGGTRAYVAVAGGFDVPAVLGSRSTDLRGGFGGCDGRALRPGDRLSHAAASPLAVSRVRELPGAAVAPPRSGVTRLRVLRGPWDDPGADRAFRMLLDGSFRLSSHSDRMGYRLEGDSVACTASGAMITAPTTMGLVQVPPSAQPILLMADRQTTGGYAPLAVVIAADLPLAGQLGPGHAVAFEPCTPDEAYRALQEGEAHLSALEAALR
jgi:antagonist of KipI